MSDVSRFGSPRPLDTAVLFLVFNRPDTTARVFEAIRQAQPTRLYLACDGPRPQVPGDLEKVERVRAQVAGNVDWQCQVSTLFNESNLGCRVAVSRAISWFFDQEEMGIVLEDDCLPSASFFPFCEELLHRYRLDARVMQICGSNFAGEGRRRGDSYYFSAYGPIWGWASWRRAWSHYDVDMALWPRWKAEARMDDFVMSRNESAMRALIYDKVHGRKIDTWDYQWGAAKLFNSGLSVTPGKNLILNIGFGSDATHPVQAPSFSRSDRDEMVFPLRHPCCILRDKELDEEYVSKAMLGGNFYSRAISRLSRLRSLVCPRKP